MKYLKTTFPIVLIILVPVLILIYAKNSKIEQSVRDILDKKISEDFLSPKIEPIKTDTPLETKRLEFSFALMSDIHNNTQGTRKAVKKINESGVELVVGLGDYTRVGTEVELINIKNELDNLTKPLYVLPGDHDLWNGRDKKNDPTFYFKKIFGDYKTELKYRNSQIIFIDNADLYGGVEVAKFEKALRDIEENELPSIIIISHKAIYHPLTIHRMGYIQEDIVETPYNQALMLVDKVSKLGNKKVHLIHGDLHSFSRFGGPTDNIINYTIGSLSKEKNFQEPRYAIGEVYSDGSLTMKDIPLE